MGRTLSFEQIADSRFGEDRATLEKRIQEITTRLSTLPTVCVQVGRVRRLTFPVESCVQYRAPFYVRKGRDTTWAQVRRAVDAIWSPHYRFLRPKKI